MASPYKALADETRRKILIQLSKNKLPAGEIASKFNISKPAISNHLKILIEADLIRTKRDRQFRIYSINKGKIKEITTFLDVLLK